MPTLNINIPDADETTKGIAEVATQVETDAGTDDTKIVTPSKLASWTGGVGANKTIITFGNSVRFSPADNGTYYFTQWNNPGNDTIEGFAESYAPVAMTIKAATITVICSPASAENVTFEIGVNGTYTAISTTAQLTSTSNKITNFSLNINVAQGDALTARMVSPTWATNPINLRWNLNIYAV